MLPSARTTHFKRHRFVPFERPSLLQRHRASPRSPPGPAGRWNQRIAPAPTVPPAPTLVNGTSRCDPSCPHSNRTRLVSAPRAGVPRPPGIPDRARSAGSGRTPGPGDTTARRCRPGRARMAGPSSSSGSSQTRRPDHSTHPEIDRTSHHLPSPPALPAHKPRHPRNGLRQP